MTSDDVTCQPAGSTNEIPHGSVTRETEVTASVIALTRSLATRGIRLYTAVPSFGSALTLPALIYGSITGEAVEVGPATTDSGAKSAAGRAPGVLVAFPPKRDS